MKAKTIKAVLRKKLDAWLETIDDDALRAQVKKNTIVTGGCIASMLLKEQVNDIDVYFRDWPTTYKVAEYYANRFKEEAGMGATGVVGYKLFDIYLADADGHKYEDGMPTAQGRVTIVCKSAGVASEASPEAEYDYFENRAPEAAGDYVSEVMDNPGAITDKIDDVNASLVQDDSKPKYRPVFLSSNAITLANQIQLIIRFYGQPDEIHENYDFVHCTNYYDSGSGELVLRPGALEALLTRELRYVGSKYPLCSLIRVRKFVQRGWSINAGQILKMAMQLNELDLKDYKVLRDQLTGVDVAYFAQVIQAVHDKDPEKVNTAYLLEIVDRLF